MLSWSFLPVSLAEVAALSLYPERRLLLRLVRDTLCASKWLSSSGVNNGVNGGVDGEQKRGGDL